MKIAVGFIHGIGKQKPDFYEGMAAALASRMHEVCPEIELISEGIYWADITDELENKLIERMAPFGLRWDRAIDARGFMISFAGDAIAYQPIPKEDDPKPHEFIYVDIHERFAGKLRSLSARAGSDAPLCLIGHSLGTIVASNYLYDLQNGKMPPRVQAIIDSGGSPLERGETLTHFYTMGSPIALWTMRFDGFGVPISIPAPNLRHADVGEWVNFYDKDDIITYPLKTLSARYDAAVAEDVEVRNPGLFAWSPLGSHGGYYHAEEIMERIVRSLADMYGKSNSRDEIAADRTGANLHTEE
ncbi:alpha/beta fold hydrolase [Cohnella suwonensis]|uniref:Alpha/beta fold hydrolase n=1 Tax=Cohnella suwonensis TaxID=696072 RepID=A0ABW0LR23_9BACL